MTDLEINIELAKAMGWDGDDISASFHKQNLEAYDFEREYWRPFDYRDPVIFVAICKHWRLDVRFSGVVFPEYIAQSYRANSIEKAATLCVIDIVKRGVK